MNRSCAIKAARPFPRIHAHVLDCADETDNLASVPCSLGSDKSMSVDFRRTALLRASDLRCGSAVLRVCTCVKRRSRARNSQDFSDRSRKKLTQVGVSAERRDVEALSARHRVFDDALRGLLLRALSTSCTEDFPG